MLRRQVQHVLQSSVDVTAFDEVCARDPVLSAARARHPRLRPVLFPSVYEALAWTLLSQRTTMAAASNSMRRLAQAYGSRYDDDGKSVCVFPTPLDLAGAGLVTGARGARMARLRHLAVEVVERDLTAERLLRLAPDRAQRELRRLDGTGAFSAELALIRGAGAPDVLPAHEGRVQTILRNRFGESVEVVAARWRPWRSWAAFLLRVDGSPVAE